MVGCMAGGFLGIVPLSVRLLFAQNCHKTHVFTKIATRQTQAESSAEGQISCNYRLISSFALKAFFTAGPNATPQNAIIKMNYSIVDGGLNIMEPEVEH